MFKAGILLLALVANVAFAFLDSSLEYENGAQYFRDQCKLHGVELDEKVFERTKNCAVKIAGKNQDQVGEHGLLQPACNFLPTGKACYKEAFDVIQRCFPIIKENPKIFELDEILVNIEAALCSSEKDPRIQSLMVGSTEAMSAMTCAVQHYQKLGEKVMSCPAMMMILLDPSVLNSNENAICKAVDDIEKCIESAVGICAKPDKVQEFVRQVYDVLVGVAFKCEKHANFRGRDEL